MTPTLCVPQVQAATVRLQRSSQVFCVRYRWLERFMEAAWPFQEDHGGVVAWCSALMGQDSVGESAHRLGGGLTGQRLADQQVGQARFPNGSPARLRPSVTPSV